MKLVVIACVAILSSCDGFMGNLRAALKTGSPDSIGKTLEQSGPIITITPKSKIGDVYDYVVVGSGSGGAVVASRLSENPSVRVLLLEVGTPETKVESVPLLAPMHQWTKHNWGHRGEPQPNSCRAMNQNSCHWPRGKAVGGSNVLSYNIYSRGNEEDHDKWGATCPGWSYADVLPFYKKSEKVQMQPGTYDSDYHGSNGSLTVEHVNSNEVIQTFLNAGIELGYAVNDYNGENQTGATYIQGTLNKGKSWSVTSAYLKDAIKRDNFHLLSGALVTKVIIQNNTAIGVTYKYNNVTYTVNAAKEVILSAGTFNTPQLLMLSGIGPEKHLAKFGIETIKDLPVGRNLHHQIAYLGACFTMPIEVVNFFDFASPKNLYQWLQYGDGFLTALGGVDGIAFIKTGVSTETSASTETSSSTESSASTETKDFPDVRLLFYSAGHLASDYGLVNKNIFEISDYYYQKVFQPMEGKPGFTIAPTVLHPKSRGRIELRSNNPEDLVRIFGKSFTAEEDLDTMVEGIQFIRSLEQTKAFKDIGAKFFPAIVPDCADLGYPSDNYFKCAVKFLTTSIHQQSGTCKMGPEEDETTVVNEELKVHGIDRLRVVDTSVFPEPLAAEYNAPGIMVGEKAAYMIQNQNNTPT